MTQKIYENYQKKRIEECKDVQKKIIERYEENKKFCEELDNVANNQEFLNATDQAYSEYKKMKEILAKREKSRKYLESLAKREEIRNESNSTKSKRETVDETNNHLALRAYTSFQNKLKDIELFDPSNNFTQEETRIIAEDKKAYNNAVKDYNDYKSKLLKTKKGLSIHEEKINILLKKCESDYKTAFANALQRKITDLDNGYKEVKKYNKDNHLQIVLNDINKALKTLEEERTKINTRIKNEKDKISSEETILDVSRGLSSLTHNDLLNQTSPEIRRLERKLSILNVFNSHIDYYEKDLTNFLNSKTTQKTM